MTLQRFARQWGPWILGLIILVVVAVRVPFDTFRTAMQHGPHLALAGATLGGVIVILCTDTLSTWFGLLTLRVRRPITTVAAVRGATNVLFLINYALGQGAFGYYLHRSGVAPLRAVGATLYLMGTNLATLLVMTTLAWSLASADRSSTMWWTLVGGCCAFALYLVVIALAPRALVRRETFAPLFEAGVRGHVLAILGRVPHMGAVVIASWLYMRVWGIAVPFTVGLALMPIVVIATVLPISPAGLGTAQAVMVYFFSAYAADATSGMREASVLAFGIVQFVYTTGWLVLIGLACIPIARRRDALRPVHAPGADVASDLDAS